MNTHVLRPGQRLYLTPDVSVIVVTVGRNKVTLGIEAPPSIPMRRAEVAERPWSPPAPA